MAAGTVNVGGTLDASAPNGGDGGFIETSAALVKIAEGVSVTTAAASGKTGNWLIDPVDFTIAASGGDITGAALGSLLTSNSITVQTLTTGVDATHLTGTRGTAGDINVNDTVSWATNTLTLKAEHNININAALNGTGSGATAAKLALQYGQASTDGTGSDYLVKAPVNLSAGENFSTQQGSDGPTKLFTVITQLGAVDSITGKDLQGINSAPGGNFALGQNIDAATSSSWNSSTGFISIPSFSGNFDGLGHTISNLIINRAGLDVGLFGNTLASATVQNIGVITSAVTGTTDVGTLVGNNAGTINNSYTASTVVGTLNAGGLVGINSGKISNSHAQSKVTLSGQAVDAATNGGGLVGSNAGLINNSYATGIINGTTSMGGLVGINVVGGKITNSNASGKVTATTSGGGLVGNNLGVIDNSFATTGAVYALTSSGGLIGSSSGQVTNSYATGAANGLTGVGGLIGLIAATPGTVSGSYAAGSATGDTDSAGVGGLVGINNGAISDSYATGRVVGTTGVGGLIGNNAATASTSKSYASGVASGTTSIGGLIGINSSTNVTSSRWDTSANALGISTGDQGTGVQGLSPDAMKIKGNFSGWDFTSSSPMWYTDGTTAPILKALIKEFKVTATGTDVTKPYDGIAFSGGTVTYSNTAVESFLSGSLAFGTGTSQGAVDVGDYIIRPSGVMSTNPQFKIVFVDGKLSITRLASVAWVGNGASNNWFDPLNWTNSAVPNKSNVANVVIPSTATVTFDNSKAAVSLAGAVNLVSINSAGAAGSLNMVSGDLNVSSMLQLANLSQTGGVVSGSANITSTKSFAQTAGSLAMSGNINLTQALGDLVVTNLSGSNITLNANKSITLGAASANGTPTTTAIAATGKLVLAFGQGAPATGNSSDYTVNGAVQLLAGGNFSTQLGLAGPVKEYTVVTALGEATDAISATTVPITTLQGMAASINVTKNYALGKDIAAQPTINWNSAKGFTPIGTLDAPFTGSFDGLGHTITDLVISLPTTADNVGLIGMASGITDIRNVGMVGGLVTGGAGTGGLVGSAATTNITNSYTTGNVYGGAWVGGLLGNNGSGNITNSFATGNVTGTTAVGGLVGNTLTGNFKNSYATGVVHGGAGSGGLVGINTAGNFDNTYAKGNVDGFLAGGIVVAATNMGGLIGSSTSGNISYSHATGNVGTGNVPGSAGAPNMGGLLGSGTTGNISNSYATGNVNGSANIGGLVGVITTGAITESYAMGNVDGSSVIGGLVGSTTGNVMNSYASGRVKDIAGRGGLVGTTTVDIVNSYASGTSQGTTGGLVGTSGGVVTSSYWDITKGPAASIKGTGLTTDQMKIQTNFPAWDFTNIWNSNGAVPPLLNNLYRFITVQAVANSVTKTYDGTPFQGGSVSYSDPNPNYLSGALTFTGSSQGAVNVGNTYVITPGGLTSTNPQYILNFVSGKLTINRLATATWTGGGTDTNWFNSANWANGTIPTLSNVANVNIPTGKTASFDVSKATTAQSGELNLDTLGSAGNISLVSGTVNAATSVNLATLSQSGGTLGGAGYVVVDKFIQTGGKVANLGDFTVSQAFTQSAPGTIVVGGNVNIRQSTGDLSVVNIDANNITLRSNQSVALGGITSRGKLALEYGQSTAAGETSDYTIGGPVTLSAGSNFSSQMGNEGALKEYTVITTLGQRADATAAPTVTTLQGIAATSNLGKNFVLGNNIDATATSNSAYNGSSGFKPIGDTTYSFTGSFDGLGHTITGLTLNMGATANAGLFGHILGSPVVQNVGLVGGTIAGGAATGGLVGYKGGGVVKNSYTTGLVTGAAFTGGLVGQNFAGDITDSFSTGTIKGAAYTGGLVGAATTGNITNSHATGNVSGAAGTGGLIGTITTGSVTNSFASGEVRGGAGTGGLIGTSTGLVTQSYATGLVIGTVEGVSGAPGSASVGGLIGHTTGPVSLSYALGAVRGADAVGGLVGSATDQLITDTYATGAVYGSTSIIGGLIGSTTGLLKNSYATGVVTSTAPSTTGALAGKATAAISNSFYNKDINGSMIGVGAQSSTGGVTGLSTSEMKVATNFTTAINSTAVDGSTHAPAWDFANTWTMGANGPILQKLITSFTVTADSVSKTYDGLKYSGLYTSSFANKPLGFVNNGVSYSGTALLATNAGQYVITPALINNPQYVVTYVNGTLTINQAQVSASAINLAGSRVYDGTTVVAANIFTLSGLLNGDTLGLTGAGFVANKNVGVDKAVTLGTLALANASSGAGLASNYTFAGGTQKATITARPLTITATSTGDKTYNGLTNASVSLSSDAITGDDIVANTASNFNGGSFVVISVVNGINSVSITNSPANFADKNAGKNKAITVIGLTATGTDVGNYTLAKTTAETTGTVVAKDINVAALGKNKVYDATANDAVTLSSTGQDGKVGVVLGDRVTFSSTAATFDAGKNVGADKKVSVSGISASGLDANNYTLANTTATTKATITPKVIVVTAKGTNRDYDGTKDDAVTLASTGILTPVNGAKDDIGFTNTSALFATKTAGVSKAVTVSGIALTGADKGNYTTNSTAKTTATITPKTITVTAAGIGKVYDGNLIDAVDLSSTGIITGDTVTYSKKALFIDKNAGTDKTVNVTSIRLGGLDGANYKANTTATTTANITPKPITVTATGTNKVYDGSLNDKVTLKATGVISGDAYGLSSTSALFEDKNVSSSKKTIAVSGITLTGVNSGNYTTNKEAETTAYITQKSITVTALGQNKVFDGSRDASVTLSSLGFITGDKLTFTNTLATFASSLAGFRAIAVTGIAATGDDVLNYKILNTTATTSASITK
jgi:hypothetical protein